MKDLLQLSMKEAASQIANKKIAAFDFISAYTDNYEKESNAYITDNFENAKKQAKDIDRDEKQKDKPLCAMPIAIKDNFCTNGIRTTAGSKMLENFIPHYESTVSGNLLKAGAINIGKTNMDEFANGSSNITSFFGPVVSPWKIKGNENKKLVPGGSSGGSAAAVSGGYAIASVGTDTGGSVRQPAAWCGIVGVKPTYGTCSRYGMIAYASSLDQAGAFAKNVDDAAILLSHMQSHDGKDASSIENIINHNIDLKDDNKMTIGIVKEIIEDAKSQIDSDILKSFATTVDVLKKQGINVVEISMPDVLHSLDCYYVIAPAELNSNLARFDGIRYGYRAEGKNLNEIYVNTRTNGFGDEIKRRILVGAYVLSSGHYDEYYGRACKVRQLIFEEFKEAYQKVDAIIMPTTPCTAFTMDNINPDPMYMYNMDMFTVPVNLAGLPAISVPSGLSRDGLPIGMQIIAPKFKESTMFKIAKRIENELGTLI